MTESSADLSWISMDRSYQYCPISNVLPMISKILDQFVETMTDRQGPVMIFVIRAVGCEILFSAQTRRSQSLVLFVPMNTN